MSLKEAIEHLNDILINEWECEKCKKKHIQLRDWLIELRDIKNFLSGEWVESEKVENLLGMSFDECLRLFDFTRIANWWCFVGKTDEERKRNGQKIDTFFRLKKREVKNDNQYKKI